MDDAKEENVELVTNFKEASQEANKLHHEQKIVMAQLEELKEKAKGMKKKKKQKGWWPPPWWDE